MYEHQGINNMPFVALYVTVAMMATLAGVYLLATRGNAFTREVTTACSVSLGIAATSRPSR